MDFLYFEMRLTVRRISCGVLGGLPPDMGICATKCHTCRDNDARGGVSLESYYSVSFRADSISRLPYSTRMTLTELCSLSTR